MKIFKYEAYGHTVYVHADTIDEARCRLIEFVCLRLPDLLIDWTSVDEVPKDGFTI